MFPGPVSAQITFEKTAADKINWYAPVPADWPKLAVRYQVVPDRDLGKICGEEDSYGGACTHFDFDSRVCTVTVNYSSQLDFNLVYVHENKGHCEGYPDWDSNLPAELWAAWKKSRKLSPL